MNSLILIDKVTGYKFEEIVKVLLQDLSFNNVEVTKKSGDFGVDIIAFKENKKWGIQIKRFSKKVGLKAIQEANSGKQHYKCDYALVITNNYFTPQAIQLAESCNVFLKDRSDIEQWLNSKSQKTVDFFEQKKIIRGRIKNQELIDNYYAVKDELGKVPSVKDMDNKNISHFSSSTYSRRFGGWNNFLFEIKENFNYKTYSRDDLIQEYDRIKKQLGSVPTINQMKKLSNISPATFANHFGSWNAFLEHMGENVNKKTKITESDKQNCMKVFEKLKKELGHVPKSTDIQNCKDVTYHAYRTIWGSYSNFLKERGEGFQKRNIAESDLRENYFKIKRRLRISQRPLKLNELKNGNFCPTVYQRRFGTYNKYLKFIREIKN